MNPLNGRPPIDRDNERRRIARESDPLGTAVTNAVDYAVISLTLKALGYVVPKVICGAVAVAPAIGKGVVAIGSGAVDGAKVVSNAVTSSAAAAGSGVFSAASYVGGCLSDGAWALSSGVVTGSMAAYNGVSTVSGVIADRARAAYAGSFSEVSPEHGLTQEEFKIHCVELMTTLHIESNLLMPLIHRFYFEVRTLRAQANFIEQEPLVRDVNNYLRNVMIVYLNSSIPEFQTPGLVIENYITQYDAK